MWVSKRLKDSAFGAKRFSDKLSASGENLRLSNDKGKTKAKVDKIKPVVTNDDGEASGLLRKRGTHTSEFIRKSSYTNASPTNSDKRTIRGGKTSNDDGDASGLLGKRGTHKSEFIRKSSYTNACPTRSDKRTSGLLRKRGMPKSEFIRKSSYTNASPTSSYKRTIRGGKTPNDDGDTSGSLRKRGTRKSEFIKKSSYTNASPTSSDKRTIRGGKKLNDDSVVIDDQPKKRKRVIRIDPYDISNKRLDDSIVIDGNTEEKKKDLERKTEMSKNAQFRAIQPSPSILSFVEDNLLGRRRLIELKRAGYNIDLSAPLDNIPFSTSSERERIEENIFRNKLTFFAAAKASSSFPPPSLPEIAFAGRSNVGKSSLLNSLTRQWGVVRTSDKPGLTQTINFFNLETKLCLVDLPGYGFAYAKEEVKDAWEELVKEYVSTRVGLKRVCLLIDTKWGMKPRDHELIDLMERSQTKYQIVLTKTDTVFPVDVARRATQIEESLKAKKSIVQPTMMVSSKSGAGIRSLRTVLAKIARFAKL
ncbi:putative GTP binding protein [Quillaja saponaria]|nr:putative GTP binding protein [Quillaja saponaria]